MKDVRFFYFFAALNVATGIIEMSLGGRFAVNLYIGLAYLAYGGYLHAKENWR